MLSEKPEAGEKLKILENEYHIPVSDGMKSEVDIMCNLSQGIEERATERAKEKTTEELIIRMYEKNIELSKIADVTGKTEQEIEAILERK